MTIHQLAILLSLFWVALCTAVCEAQQRPSKTRPPNYQSTEIPKEGERASITRTTTETVVSDGVSTTREKKVQVAVVVPQRKWMIGAQGWYDDEGFNIDNLVRLSVGGRRHESPLSRVRTFINGRVLDVALEPGDVVTRIDGIDAKNELDMFIAVNAAQNPRDLSIEFINNRNGQTMTGSISAVKVRP
ncbi:MAG: hypothetical protein ACJ8F7_06335 [Gemmataceae bacterium]